MRNSSWWHWASVIESPQSSSQTNPVHAVQPRVRVREFTQWEKAWVGGAAANLLVTGTCVWCYGSKSPPSFVVVFCVYAPFKKGVDVTKYGLSGQHFPTRVEMCCHELCWEFTLLALWWSRSPVCSGVFIYIYCPHTSVWWLTLNISRRPRHAFCSAVFTLDKNRCRDWVTRNSVVTGKSSTCSPWQVLQRFTFACTVTIQSIYNNVLHLTLTAET